MTLEEEGARRRAEQQTLNWLDRLFGYLDRPSADRILPEFQHLEVGDEIPLGAGMNWPVQALEPNRSLLLGKQGAGQGFTWSFGLYALDDYHTRLVSRVRGRLVLTPQSLPIFFALDPAAFVMERGCC
jgi:hypothetical protein